MSLRAEIRIWDDEIVFLGSKGFTKDDSIQTGDVARAGGESRHRLDVAKVAGGGKRRRSGAASEWIGHGGRSTAIGGKVVDQLGVALGLWK